MLPSHQLHKGNLLGVSCLHCYPEAGPLKRQMRVKMKAQQWESEKQRTQIPWQGPALQLPVAIAE